MLTLTECTAKHNNNNKEITVQLSKVTINSPTTLN